MCILQCSDVPWDVYSHLRVCCIPMTGRVPSNCSVRLVFYVKNITFDSVGDPILVCPTYAVLYQLHSRQ